GDAVHSAITASGGAIVRRSAETPRQLGERLAHWARDIAADAGLRPTLPAARSADAGTAALAARTARLRGALDALAQRQLLCALRETEFGALAANSLIERALRQAWDVADAAEWYPGRAVMITRNDYGAGLFNGDVGLCLADNDGRLQVWFEAPASGVGATALRSFAPTLLPAHESAFAVTIHKSQGSEYDHVAVLLPPDADNRILSRQLLYTGVSRARRRVELWSSEAALLAALRRPLQRHGGLRDRLLDAPPAAAPEGQLEFGF